MAYRPAQRRMNLIRVMCVQWLRDNIPARYALIVEEAEQHVKKGKGGWDIGRRKRKAL